MMLVLNADKGERLKSFSSASRNGKGVIRIEIEFTALERMGWTLADLQQTASNQMRSKAKRQVLSLPSPEDYP